MDVVIALYNSENKYYGKNKYRLLGCDNCKVYFADFDLYKKMRMQKFPVHSAFIPYKNSYGKIDKHFLLKNMYNKNIVDGQNDLIEKHNKIPKDDNDIDIIVKREFIAILNSKIFQTGDDKNSQVINNEELRIIRYIPVIDRNNCPCCSSTLYLSEMLIAYCGKDNCIKESSQPLLCCEVCNLYFASEYIKTVINKKLFPHHPEFFILNDLGRNITKDLIEKRMYMRETQPVKNQLIEHTAEKINEGITTNQADESLVNIESIVEEANTANNFSDNHINTDNVEKAFVTCDKINLTNNEQVVLVYSHLLGCYKHSIKPAKAIVNDLNNNICTIYVDYCSDCNRYFIDEKSLQTYHKKFGIILLKIELDKSQWQGNGDFNRKPESILMLLGYNVREGELSESKRHTLLSKIIDNGLIERGEVIKYLRMFIDTNGENYNNRFAKEKWQNDLNFIRQHNADRTILGQLKHI